MSVRIEQDLTFPARYLVDIAPGWPQPDEAILHAQSPRDPLESVISEFLNLRFYPEAHASWFGEFEMSQTKASAAVFTTPDPDVAFVQAGWRTYRVDVACKVANHLHTYPTVQIKADPYRNLLWLVRFDRIDAFTADGTLAWTSDRLFFDALRVLEIAPDQTVVEGYDGGSTVRTALRINGGKPVPR